MSEQARLEGQHVTIRGDQVQISGNPIDFTNSPVINFNPGDTTTLTSLGGTSIVGSGVGPGLTVKGMTAGANMTISAGPTALTFTPAVTTLASSSGLSIVNTSIGPGLGVAGLIAGNNIAISQQSNSVRFDVTGSSPEMGQYNAVYYTTGCYTSSDSCAISLSKNLTSNVVSGTLDYTLGSNFTTNAGIMYLLPSTGTPPFSFLPANLKYFPVIITADSVDYPAELLMDPSGNFTFQFLGIAAVRPDAGSQGFNNGQTVNKFNFGFTYSTVS